MVQLLKEDYPNWFGLTRGHISVSVECKDGDFELYDDKACTQCNHQCRDKAILKISSEIDVTEIDIDEYFNQFQNTRADISGGRCDKFLYDDLDCRIAFVEMTCKEVTEERHLNLLSNKRAKAYEQLRNTIDKLMSVTAIKDRVNSFKVRSAVFAYRQNDREDSLSNVLHEVVTSFAKPMILASDPNLTADMGNDFAFQQIRYPDVLEW